MRDVRCEMSIVEVEFMKTGSSVRLFAVTSWFGELNELVKGLLGREAKYSSLLTSLALLATSKLVIFDFSPLCP